MKTFQTVIVLAATCLVLSVHAFPGSSRNPVEESEDPKGVSTVLVLPEGSKRQFERQMEFSDPEDTIDEEDDDIVGDAYEDGLMAYPFQEFLSTFNDYMNSLRERIYSQLPNIKDLINGSRIPEGANTTSTTKVINGHVVTINDTVYSDGNDSQGTFVRVRFIDVKPQNETGINSDGNVEEFPVNTPSTVETEKEETTPTRNAESAEDLDNEIPKNNQADLAA